MNASLKILCAATAAFAAASSQAQTFYGYDPSMADLTNHNTAKASFIAAAGSVSTLDFESVAVGAQSNSPISFGSFTGSLTTGTGPGVAEADVRDSSIYGASAFSGTHFFLGLGSAGETLLTVHLDQAVKSVGFSLSDEADFGQSSNPGHELVLGNGEVYSLTPNIPYDHPDGNAAFFGVVSATTFDTFSIRYPSNGFGTGTDADAVGIDDIVVAAPVPEPATLAVLGLGLVTVRRRKR